MRGNGKATRATAVVVPCIVCEATIPPARVEFLGHKPKTCVTCARQQELEMAQYGHRTPEMARAMQTVEETLEHTRTFKPE